MEMKQAGSNLIFRSTPSGAVKISCGRTSGEKRRIPICSWDYEIMFSKKGFYLVLIAGLVVPDSS